MTKKLKIGLIKCSGSLNVGNEFINAGGEYVMKHIFPDAEFQIFEFFDSAIPNNYKYHGPALLDWAKKALAQCDLMVVFSGCIISKYTASVLQELANINVKKILLGAGAYQYDEFDKKLCHKIAPEWDYIFTRDSETFSYFDNAKNVYSGIDLAFFAQHRGYCDSPKGDYALVNLDLIEHNKSNIRRAIMKLRWKFRNVFVIENTTTKYTNLKHFLYCGYWDTLYNTISHAKYVITNRIHTSVVCMCHQVPFLYTGSDCHQNGIGRHGLFQRILQLPQWGG